MKEFKATELRNYWGEVSETAKRTPVVITSHGKPQLALIDYSLAKTALQALEDLEDIKIADEITKSIKDNTEALIRLEDVANELGITL